MQLRVTQSDVARHAGVHRTTVSLALRNHPSIPLATRRRIKKLADTLHYRPDPSLSALMVYRSANRCRKITSALGYITHWTTRWGWKASPAHAQFYAGALAKATELGFQLEHFWLGEENISHHRLNEILLARGIRGLVLASHCAAIDQPIGFDWDEFTAVKIDFYPASPQLNKVTNDQRSIIQTAMRRILALGYRRIGFVVSEIWDDFDDLAWSAGFLAVQARLPADDRVPLLCYPRSASAPGCDDLAIQCDALSVWLKTYEPEVILGYGPYVLPQLQVLGIRVPHDLAFADIFLTQRHGEIAGVIQNCERVGEVAIENLASQLSQNLTGLPAYPTATFVDGTWQDGHSLPNRNVATLLAS
jgi:LacI family transcriptional regulator